MSDGEWTELGKQSGVTLQGRGMVKGTKLDAFWAPSSRTTVCLAQGPKRRHGESIPAELWPAKVGFVSRSLIFPRCLRTSSRLATSNLLQDTQYKLRLLPPAHLNKAGPRWSEDNQVSAHERLTGKSSCTVGNRQWTAGRLGRLQGCGASA